MSKLILSTGNIVSGGPSIIRKPGAYRSNLELTNSLRSNFLAAQEYYGSVAATAEDDPLAGNGNGNGNGHSNGNGRSNGSNGHPHSNSNGRGSSLGARLAQSYPYIWTEWRKRDGAKDGEQGEEEEVLYIPRIDWSTSGLQEEAAQYDITVKLFFLPAERSGSTDTTNGGDVLAKRQALAAARAGYAREALDLVLRELGGAPSVDLLIVSFPGMSFDGDCEWEADKANAGQGDDDEEAATWRAVADELHTHRGLVRRLGIAEFGSEKLARFLKRIAGGGSEDAAAAPRPSVDQINIKNCCNVPPPLVKLAKAEGIELLVHSDCTDVLPTGTLRELLGSGPRGAGILINDDDDDDEVAGHPARVRGDITPQWVVKYTAVVRDRGVIENKGYFASALFTMKE